MHEDDEFDNEEDFDETDEELELPSEK